MLYCGRGQAFILESEGFGGHIPQLWSAPEEPELHSRILKHTTNQPTAPKPASSLQA